MKDVFMPYYINGNNIKNLFQIAINRFGNIDVNINRLDTTIELNVPLSEITCGKIIQGSAKITILRSNILTEIDFETKASIDAFINLESILNKNNAMKILNSSYSLNNLNTGDIVEITAIIRQIDPILSFFQKTLHLLQFREITHNEDHSKMIHWINKNIDTILNVKDLKFLAVPNFTTDENIIISLDTSNSILDVDYYLNRPVTIVGQIMSVSSAVKSNSINDVDYNDNNIPDTSTKNKRPFCKDFSINTIFGQSLKSFPLTNHGSNFNLNVHLLWDYLNSSDKYADFLDHLNYPAESINSNNRTIEIMPLMIYL